MKKLLIVLGIFLATSAIAEDKNWVDDKYIALCYAAEPTQARYLFGETVWVTVDRKENSMQVRRTVEKNSGSPI